MNDKAGRDVAMSVLARVSDPDGVMVELTDTQWRHIVDRRPLLAGEQAAILQAVKAPDAVASGRKSNERWFLKAGVGPSQWLRVVVAYEAGRGWIVTAFPRRKFP